MPKGPPAPSAAVDLALVLAIDESGSVDDGRWALQLEGYRQAFQSREFFAAVQAGRLARIAMTFVEWSGVHRQRQTVGWTMIENEQSAQWFADAIVKSPRNIPDWTSISGAIDYSVKLLADSEGRATRRVVDISGDGSNNDGRPVTTARDEAIAVGITINGLPILGVERALDTYYSENVIGGSGRIPNRGARPPELLASCPEKAHRRGDGGSCTRDRHCWLLVGSPDGTVTLTPLLR